MVGLEGGGLARRYVFEVSTGDRHLAQLRYKDRLGRERLCLSAEIALPADISSDDIWIEARRSFWTSAGAPFAEDQAKLGPRPFRVLVR